MSVVQETVFFQFECALVRRRVRPCHSIIFEKSENNIVQLLTCSVETSGERLLKKDDYAPARSRPESRIDYDVRWREEPLPVDLTLAMPSVGPAWKDDGKISSFRRTNDFDALAQGQ